MIQSPCCYRHRYYIRPTLCSHRHCHSHPHQSRCYIPLDGSNTERFGRIHAGSINRMPANGRGDAKNKAEMFSAHCAPQITQKQSQIPIRMQQTSPSATTADKFLQVDDMFEKHPKGTSIRSCHMEKWAVIPLFVQFPPGWLSWSNNGQSVKVVAVSDTFMIL